MFTSDDIRKLLDTFPLESDPCSEPSALVYGSPGDHLARSEIVHKRFRRMLDDETELIDLTNLANTLGVQDIQWLLKLDRERLLFDQRRQRLVPRHVEDRIVSAFENATRQGFVEEDEFAAAHDLDMQSLAILLARWGLKDDLVPIRCEQQVYLCKEPLVESISERLRAVLSTMHKSTEPVELTGECPHVPFEVLYQLAKRVLDTAKEGPDYVVDWRPDSIHFVPKSAAAGHGEIDEQSEQHFVDSAMQMLREVGFCDLGLLGLGSDQAEFLNAIATKVMDEYHAQSSDNLVRLVPAPRPIQASKAPGSHLLVASNTLERRRIELTSAAVIKATDLWANRQPGQEINFDPDTAQDITVKKDTCELDLHIIGSAEGDAIVQSFDEKVQELRSEAIQSYRTKMKRELLIPLRLYYQGVDMLTEPTLRSNVGIFVKDHFGQEVVPDLLKELRTGLFIPSKAAMTDTEKLGSAVHDALSLEDLQAAVKKFSRKQKIEQPTRMECKETLMEILDRKVQSMLRMKRSSDLLQNLTWNLLAKAASANAESSDQGRSNDCLFMASGKDASRMIRFYSGFAGHGDVAARLEALKDVIKQSKDTEEHRAEMREMAKIAVQDMIDSSGA